MKKLMLGIVIVGLVSLGIVYLNRATPFPFTSLVKDDDDEFVFKLLDAGDELYLEAHPIIMALPSEAYENLEPFIPHTDVLAVEARASKNTILLAALQGFIAQVPHGIDVQRMTFKDQQLNVYVLMHTTTTTLIRPGGGTSDFEIVAIDRADLSATDGPITVQMIDQHGDTLATTTFDP